MPDRHLIRVCGVADPGPWRNLTQILENLLPVRFDFAPVESGSQEPATLVSANDSAPLNGKNSSRLTFAGIRPDPNAQPREVAIQFSDDHEVPFPFRGRSVR